MNLWKKRSVVGRQQHGFTLIELIVATAILVILVGMAFPVYKNSVVRRARARVARRPLDDARRDRSLQGRRRSGAFQTKVDSQNYPPDLDTLVKGVDVAGKKLKFLRRIPVDPMTKQEWGMRSMQDDKDSDSWGGQNVFDVYTKSDQVALDGTKYKDW